MKEYDKRNNHISNKHHMIYKSYKNIRHPLTKIITPLQYTSSNYISLHFTTLHPTTFHSTSLHYTCRHFTSFHLNFTQLRFTTLSFGLTQFKSPPLNSPHITTLHLTALHCTFRWFSPQFSSFHFLPFIISFLTLFPKILALQGKVPNASAGSWLQFLMLLFAKE